MPKNFDDLDEQKSLKMLLVGHAGTGKTGSLASLAEAGFQLKILDIDNNLAPLLANLTETGKKNISVHQLGERIKFNPATMTAAPGSKTKVFKNAMRAMDNWNFDDPDAPKLPVDQMGPNDIVVIDSANLLGKAILKYVLELEGKLGQKVRIQDWGAAGGWFLAFLENLVSDEIKCNVIFLTHMTGVEMEDEKDVFFPAAISKGTHLDFPKYFDTMLLCQTVGVGASTKRVIRTKATQGFATKCAVECADNLPIKTGLVSVFEAFGIKPAKAG